MTGHTDRHRVHARFRGSGSWNSSRTSQGNPANPRSTVCDIAAPCTWEGKQDRSRSDDKRLTRQICLVQPGTSAGCHSGTSRRCQRHLCIWKKVCSGQTTFWTTYPVLRCSWDVTGESRGRGGGGGFWGHSSMLEERPFWSNDMLDSGSDLGSVHKMSQWDIRTFSGMFHKVLKACLKLPKPNVKGRLYGPFHPCHGTFLLNSWAMNWACSMVYNSIPAVVPTRKVMPFFSTS